MFNNLNWWNVAVLLLLALFIFGDKLPQVISDGMRLLRNLRRMARNATSDLSRELGTDIQLEDLHPKTFIRKHVLSESDQEALVRPLRGLSEDLAREARGLEQDIKDVGRRVEAPPEGAGSGRRRGPAPAAVSDPVDGPADAGPPAPTPRHSYDDIS